MSHCNNIPIKIDSLKARLACLDGRGEDVLLSLDEIVEICGITHEIQFLSRVNTSNCWQQSQLLWLNNGDANSKLFHTVLSSRRRLNSIVSFVEEVHIVEGVQPIFIVVFTHFSNHFKARSVGRPGVRNMPFKTLYMQNGGSLVKPFTV